ncbi:hypothetical protein MSAN_01622400 [Mycena sanguinolenta]|uniref:Uncharacterized protein n=1 Tax=Mycena sanguinolenta TaxID=230812 RepID=A0A8H7CWC8_9AGAR|nr:hypothetical protein MSAN_01622400 [Mycena sanguinolenta]
MAPSVSRDTPAHLPSLSPHKFSLLTTILRETNKHYSAVAFSVRSLIRPKHHARSRAQKLGLVVNTWASVNPDFPGREVLFQALPALERPLSASPRAGGPMLQLTKPVGRQQRHQHGEQRDVVDDGAASNDSALSHLPAPAAAALTADDSIITVLPLLPSLLEYDDNSLFVNQPQPPTLPQLPFEFVFWTPETVFQSTPSTMSSSGPATPNDDDVIFPGLQYLVEKRKRDTIDLGETDFIVEKRLKCEPRSAEQLC